MLPNRHGGGEGGKERGTFQYTLSYKKLYIVTKVVHEVRRYEVTACILEVTYYT